jgi:hypothetical protein
MFIADNLNEARAARSWANAASDGRRTNDDDDDDVVFAEEVSRDNADMASLYA